MTHEPAAYSSVGSGQDFTLDDGARVGVVGAGPAGSLFACFLLDRAVARDAGAKD